jgi:hypothetical protein
MPTHMVEQPLDLWIRQCRGRFVEDQDPAGSAQGRGNLHQLLLAYAEPSSG